MATLVITYALPLVQAAVARRKLAFAISLLGKTPQQIVIRASHPKNIQALESTLQTLASDLMQCSEQQLAYPILDLFYCRQHRYSLGLQVARLDGALSLLAFGLKPDARFQSDSVSDLQEVIKQYLYRVQSKAYEVESEAPPVPSTGLIEDRKLSLLNAEEMEENFKSLLHRRLHLRKLVLDEGWEWLDVEREDPEDVRR
jgi:hypothetical protein